MIRLATLCGIAGLALATAIFVYQGIGPVLALLATAGVGIVWASLFHIVPMVINARAWQILLPGSRPPSLMFFTWAVWVREAVNGLLPVARIGGEVVSVRMLTQGGVRTSPAVASLVADMTLCIIAQFLFTILGLALMLRRTDDVETIGIIVLGLLLSVPVLVALWLVQRHGFFALLVRLFRAMFGERFDPLAGGARRLDRAVRVFYRRPGRVFWCCAWQLIASIVAAGEVWLALYFLGHPISIVDAILIESLTQAISSAAFIVPGAIGVQEGGYLVIGTMLGLPPDIALALALARRARDLIIFVPALVAWQIAEGRRWVATA